MHQNVGPGVKLLQHIRDDEIGFVFRASVPIQRAVRPSHKEHSVLADDFLYFVASGAEWRPEEYRRLTDRFFHDLLHVTDLLLDGSSRFLFQIDMIPAHS